MRYITADYIFPASSPPIKNGMLAITEEGFISDIFTQPETRNLKPETYIGVICPGFINAHCHLELSYMKGLITEQRGLAGFIREFLQNRNQAGEKTIHKKIIEAETEIIANGIVAVGDISNSDSTFSQKSKGNLFYHTFIELFDLIPGKAKEVFKNGLQLQTSNFKLQTSLVPHAPYSVSTELMKMISEEAIKSKSALSIHNQETESENELFKNKTGKLFEFFKSMNVYLEHLPMTGKSSIESYLPLLPKENKILLVHNTFSKKEDIQFAHNHSKNIYWCFCPNANLYIENTLPDYEMFIEEKANVVLERILMLPTGVFQF